VNCLHCGKPIPAGSRRDRAYCGNNCSARASEYRRKNGIEVPPRWQHPAFTSEAPLLRVAAERARQLGEANGWSSSLTRCAIDGLVVLLDGRPDGERVTLTEIRARTGRHASVPRVAEVLAGLGLLEDDTVPAIRAWIDRHAGEMPPGFPLVVRDWLLVLLDGDARSRPRSATTIYVYCTAVEPLIGRWSASHGHLREVTADDIRSGLEELRGHPLCTAISAVRSLFRFARRRGLIFANPARRLSAAEPEPSLLPMTDGEIRAVEQAITLPGQRLIVALAAVHAARWEAIQALTLDDLDLPNRRITIAGHPQRLGDLSHKALRAWLDYRRATWPHTSNRHVLISERTALGDVPVTRATSTSTSSPTASASIADGQRVGAALGQADAAGMADELPRGPQTRIGKHLAAVDLSEGQWQKVSLARSLMREHALLLIMDEPTAALDAHSERRIFEQFIRHARDLGRETGAITIVVSHRSSTIKDADVILVLDKGALVQAGSHDDLIRRAGQPYARLYRLQAEAYR
jgi:integrase